MVRDTAWTREWKHKVGVTMNKPLLIETVLQLWKEAHHFETWVRETKNGPPRAIHFTTYERSDPKPCECEGCVHTKEHQAELAKVLDRMSVQEILDLLPEPSDD